MLFHQSGASVAGKQRLDLCATSGANLEENCFGQEVEVKVVVQNIEIEAAGKGGGG